MASASDHERLGRLTAGQKRATVMGGGIGLLLLVLVGL